MSFVKEETPTNTPTDLISRQDAIDAVRKIVPYVIDKDTGQWGILVNKANIISAIKSLPSAEPKTGEWIWSDEDASWKCGCCDCVFEEIDWKPNYNYCPNCGADMRGEEE